VLQTLPGIEASVAEAIVSTRQGLPPEKRRSISWIFQEDLVNADVFKKVAPYITTQTWQFSFYVVGYGLPSGRYRVLEVTIDTAAPEPAVTYMRDITRLGLPFPLLPKTESTGSATVPVAKFRGAGAAKRGVEPKNEQVAGVQRPHMTAVPMQRQRNHG
jgi:hypothetical protein